MAVLPIIKIGHPSLRKVAEEVKDFRQDLKLLANDMIETMQVNSGIGLAGNQVNVLLRLFVIDCSLIEDHLEPQAYVNPRIISAEGEDTMEEGCLSIPDVNADVTRPDIIKVQYQTLEGKEVEEELSGLHGRVFQHELDHLNGVLFVDRIPPLERKMLEPRIKKIMEEYSIA